MPGGLLHAWQGSPMSPDRADRACVENHRCRSSMQHAFDGGPASAGVGPGEEGGRCGVPRSLRSGSGLGWRGLVGQGAVSPQRVIPWSDDHMTPPVQWIGQSLAALRRRPADGRSGQQGKRRGRRAADDAGMAAWRDFEQQTTSDSGCHHTPRADSAVEFGPASAACRNAVRQPKCDTEYILGGRKVKTR